MQITSCFTTQTPLRWSHKVGLLKSIELTCVHSDIRREGKSNERKKGGKGGSIGFKVITTTCGRC